MRKLLIIVVLVAVSLLAWCPWIDEEFVKNRVSQQANFADQHKNLGSKPEVHVFYAPFGRWVTTIEGGWFVTFWGEVIP